MIPKMAAPEKRKGASQVTMRAAATGAANAGATLRAADYTPPAGFVETMERPSPYSGIRGPTSLSGGKGKVRFAEKQDGLSNVLDELWKM